MSREFFRPPKGFKNIDIARAQFQKLEASVDVCSEDAPALTYSSTRWLENAFHSREIIEEEYDSRMNKIKEQTRKFIEKCSCAKK